MNNVNMDALRLIVQGVVAVGVLTAASFLTISGHLTSDAVVALYGAAIGAVSAAPVVEVITRRKQT